MGSKTKRSAGRDTRIESIVLLAMATVNFALFQRYGGWAKASGYVRGLTFTTAIYAIACTLLWAHRIRMMLRSRADRRNLD